MRVLESKQRFGVVVALAFAAGGCSFFKSILASDFKKPGLTFQNASLSEISLAGATVDLNFKVDNPNGEAISLAETDYTLLVEGKQLVAGKPPAGIQIPANGSADVTLPASVKFADLAGTVEALLKKQEAAYKAEGHIGVQTAIGVVSLPFSTEGTVPLPRLPSVRVGSPTLTDMSLSGATLRLPLLFDNPNAFPLPLGEVTGALRIAGAEVGSFAARDVGKLEARSTKTVMLPLAVKFSGALAAFRALESGHAEVALSGALSSGGASLPFQVVQQVEIQR